MGMNCDILHSFINLCVQGLFEVSTTLICGPITVDTVRKSQYNYALIILRELRSSRTLWNSVYPAAE